MKSHSLLFHYLKGWLLLLLLSLIFSIGANYFAEQSLVRHIKQSLINQAVLFEAQITERLERESHWMKFLASNQGARPIIEELFREYEEEGISSSRYHTLVTRFNHDNRFLFKSNQTRELLLLNRVGELVYSLGDHDDELGEDLSRDGFYGGTILSDLFEQVMLQRNFVVSKFGKIDLFERNEPLMGVPVRGEENEPIGVMVTLFPLDWVRKILTEYANHTVYEGLGDSG